MKKAKTTITIERFGWKRLARMYDAAKPGSPLRRAIANEARRCGYTLRVILALHRPACSPKRAERSS